MTEKPSIYNTANTPFLIKALCYYIIIKTGVKITISLLLLISGGTIESLNNVIGFDTLNNGGVSLQLFIIATGALHIYGCFQLLQLKPIGIFIHVLMMLVLFFAPAFFSPETYFYTPSRLGLMLLQVLLPVAYFVRIAINKDREENKDREDA